MKKEEALGARLLMVGMAAVLIGRACGSDSPSAPAPPPTTSSASSKESPATPSATSFGAWTVDRSFSNAVTLVQRSRDGGKLELRCHHENRYAEGAMQLDSGVTLHPSDPHRLFDPVVVQVKYGQDAVRKQSWRRVDSGALIPTKAFIDELVAGRSAALEVAASCFECPTTSHILHFDGNGFRQASLEFRVACDERRKSLEFKPQLK